MFAKWLFHLFSVNVNFINLHVVIVSICILSISNFSQGIVRDFDSYVVYKPSPCVIVSEILLLMHVWIHFFL